MKSHKKTGGLSARSKARRGKKQKIIAKVLLHDVLVHQAELEIQNEELRTVQENLEAAIEKYSNYYDFAPVAYYTLDNQGHITETNLRGAAMVDTPRLQLINTPFSRWVLPGHRHLFHQLFRAAIISNKKQKVEFRLLRNGGPGILVLAEAVSAPEAQNRFHRVRLILTDVTGQRETEQYLKEQNAALQTVVDNSHLTDHKQAELSLFQERERLKGILDAMNDGVCIVGPAGDIEYANQAIEQDFGPAGRQKCDAYFHDRTPPSLWCNREEVIAGKSVTWEWFSGKSRKTYELFATPLKNSDQSVSQLMFFHDITGKREIAQALQNARNYLDASGVLMVSLDTLGKVTLINKKGCEILTLTQEAVLGKDWFSEFTSEKSRGPARDLFNRLLAGQASPSESNDTDVLTSNGGIRTFRWNHISIKDDTGAILGVVSTGTDVTGQKTGDPSAAHHDDQYRNIVETTLEGIWVYDKDCRITYANERMTQILGCALEKLIGQTILDFLPEAEKAYVLDTKEDRRRQGIREKRILKTDGSSFWALESASPLYSTTGDRIGTLGMLTDISVRKQAEESLKSAHVEMTRQVVAQSAEITYRQQALEEIYRIATEPQPSFKSRCDQIIGSLSRLLHLPCMSLYIRQNEELRPISKALDGVQNPEDCPFPGCRLLGKVADTGLLLHIKGDLRKTEPDCHCGVLHPFRTYLGIPIKSDNGDLIGIICGLDPAERDFSDNELHLIGIFSKYLTHELEQISFEKQLNQNMQLKMLGQLTSGVAHEVRNPLNAITAVTESLFQDIGNKPEYQTHMMHIRNQVERLSNLMVDLLELGRPINKTKISDVTVASVIAGVMSSWQHLPLSRKCRIQLIQPSMARKWTLNADSGKLQQVFLNLLQNAAQHSPENSEISLMIRPPKNGRITIKITDKGSGIPPKDMERMFEPFYTTRKGGTGLGLSIVKHILEVHGGSITLSNNNPPPGLTVKVILILANDGEKERG